jgi:hypothetical protein
MMSSGNEYSDSGEEEAAVPADPEQSNESTGSEKPMETSGPDSKDVQGEAAAENAKETGGYGY